VLPLWVSCHVTVRRAVIPLLLDLGDEPPLILKRVLLERASVAATTMSKPMFPLCLDRTGAGVAR